MKASLLRSTDHEWIVKKSIDLPPKRLSLNVFVYKEGISRFEDFQKSSS
jgi:hypothetical protein